MKEYGEEMKMVEKTLSLVKPDGVAGNHIGEILNLYEKEGLKIVALKMIKINKEFARQHYIDLKGIVKSLILLFRLKRNKRKQNYC